MDTVFALDLIFIISMGLIYIGVTCAMLAMLFFVIRNIKGK